MRKLVAVCLCARSLPAWRTTTDAAFFRTLVPSIMATVTPPERQQWDVQLFVGIDDDDRWFQTHLAAFESFGWLRFTATAFPKRAHRLPFNENAKVAAAAGAEYFVRINDDTEFLTPEWITEGTAALAAMNPPNVGVVGPLCHEGNTNILTHDMTHKTHMDIFNGQYYAAEFSAWWIDDWISRVYEPDRKMVMRHWVVKHHVDVHGTRYTVQRRESGLLERAVKRGKREVINWVNRPLVITYDGQTWAIPTWAIAKVWKATVLVPSGQVYNSSGIHGFNKWYWEHPLKIAAAPKSITAPAVSFIQLWNDQFQHIVFDTLPKLTFACPFIRKNPDASVLVANDLQKDLIAEICPINNARFVVADTAVTAPIVYVPHYVGFNLKMGIVPPTSTFLLNHRKFIGTDAVYLARTPNSVRSVINEGEVLATLRKRWPNLRVVYPTNNWRYDQKSMQNASVIIGPHGGAMANMIFAAPNATVIEFTPLMQLKRRNDNERPCYFGLAHGLGFTYHAVEPSQFNFDRGGMVVPKDRLQTTLDKIPHVWTILLTVNNGYFDFFQNWWAFYTRLRLHMTVVVVAEDDKVYEKLLLYGVIVQRSRLKKSASHSYGTREYKDMVSTRATHILRLLRQGKNVLYTDVDTVWRSDPTQYFDITADVVAAVDNKMYEGMAPYYCTGLMAIRSSVQAINVIQQWATNLGKSSQLNQPVFNRLIHNSRARHVGLPLALFPNGNTYFKMATAQQQKAVVIHNNFIIGHQAKLDRLQQTNLLLV